MNKLIAPYAIAFALTLSGTAFAQDTTTPAEESPEVTTDYDLDTVVATVDGVDITVAHVIAVRDRLPENYRSLPPEVLFPGLVDQLIDQQLLAEAAKETGAAETRRVRVQLDNERRGVLSNETIASVLEDAVTEDKITSAYEALTAEMTRTTEYNASHILLETEEEALEVVAALNDGGDFETLAQERSTGPSGPTGGELGWFGPGQMVPEFDAAVQSLEVGTVSEPVQTQFGWHVIVVNETRLSPLPPLEQIRPEIVGQLNQDALQAHIDSLREGADITTPEVAISPEAITTLDLTNE
ncbi:peptidylprolyl isomerase [Pontivivens nitratireducens]|uniref:Parvulin-like PPIase n=1 Tax=Pontivivens nitratireducens TaxID=2758038 RepID=A0A6G7VHI1_9RHOB|nr:peptidylprolyl isomerase [Pontibrevibacter nitratireducens]QIK39336.1 peptidylprolyl isomerase [Pontibrevibacter nitratireducens]